MPRAVAPIAAVIFDLDGVLADTIELHYQSWQRVADEFGLPFDRAGYDQILGRNREDSIDYLLAGREVDSQTRTKMLRLKNECYLELLDHLQPDDLLPGVDHLLQELQEQNIAIALGSSSKNAEIVLRKLGVRHFFQQVADGTSVDRAKPAPDVFFKAAALLGIAPQNCLVVEDAAAGVDAGLAAGMTVLGVGPKQRLCHAHLVVSSLADFHWSKLVQELTN
jgi:beta-phosphoglucomutase